ncbi:MAG: methyltransferase domain-containing protein [Elusimicrobia bacterium]|nr:methyltransferase domain-containing protein [Elusimicrobiota bacterium]
MIATTAELKDSSILHKPDAARFERGGLFVFVDGDAPNWAALDARGAGLYSLVDGARTLGEVRRLHAESSGADASQSWLDVQSLSRGLLHAGLLSFSPIPHRRYAGRSAHLEPRRLSEFWVHLLQTCNISCTHCLVSSGPDGEKGPEKAFLEAVIEQAHALGARRFFFTGGEPFVRPDLFDLVGFVTETKASELVIMTNATLLTAERLAKLAAFDLARLKFQVSLDGATAAVNDAIRGKGVFQKASAGLTALAEAGFETSLTAVVTRENLKDLEALPELGARLGAKSLHLMWAHKRGRIVSSGGDPFPTNAELLALARRVRDGAGRLGLVLDNAESLRRRANGRPGVKNDLGNQCWESLCLYRDGGVYPSAATAGLPELKLGDVDTPSLKALWLDSPVARKFREATLAGGAENDPFRFLTGGGDVEHSYFFSSNGHTGSLVGHDPYHPLYVELMKDEMFALAEGKRAAFNARSGFRPPVVLHAMGQDAFTCSDDATDWLGEDGKTPEVRLTHSNCVLAFDVERPYRIVQGFYGKAAVEPQKELCCPVKYSDDEVGHIPQAVLDRFYGCGSPISSAGVRPGETTLDLGSGAGIDCFIAAKKVGPTGKVIGVDMTAEMLKVARECRPQVAAKLGYDVVDFREGYLETVPAEDKSVDLVTSNCVVNLSPDKPKVFAEIWRILKDHGRLVVADIVADRPVPLNLQAHKDLWGECISGSLSEEEFLSGLERAGFYGVSVLKRTFWKEVEGYKFFSLTVRGFKFEKKAGCRFVGQTALYLGPHKAVIDEEGHLFPRYEPVEVCTDTAAKLSHPPYAGSFFVSGEPTGPAAEEACCAPEGSCC